MASKYTHDELTKRMTLPGWVLVTSEKDRSATGTLEHVLKTAHQNRKLGQAPGLIEEIKTTIELDMIQIEELWQHLGLPL